MDWLKRQCTDQGNLLTAIEQMIDPGTSHHPPNVMESNDSQAKQPSTSIGTSVFSGSTHYSHPPEITEEHMAEP
jgi:hypothetical protein